MEQLETKQAGYALNEQTNDYTMVSGIMLILMWVREEAALDRYSSILILEFPTYLLKKQFENRRFFECSIFTQRQLKYKELFESLKTLPRLSKDDKLIGLKSQISRLPLDADFSVLMPRATQPWLFLLLLCS